MNSSGIWTELTVPTELTDGLGNLLTDTLNTLTMNLFNLLPSLLMILGYIIMIVLAVMLILTVFGRFFKLYMFLAISPIPLSTFGSRKTAGMGKNYLKSFVSACLDGAVIALARLQTAMLRAADQPSYQNSNAPICRSPGLRFTESSLFYSEINCIYRK